MKPTEQDIQAELIDGWEITGRAFHHSIENGGFFEISGERLRVTFYQSTGKYLTIRKIDGEKVRTTFPEFLTGNYDLSAISKHYDPEEWQRIISMCERIVRLITGEQTLEEKVREILEPFTDGTHAESVEPDKVVISRFRGEQKYHITHDHITRFSDNINENSRIDYKLDEYRERNCSQLGLAYLSIAALLTPSDQPEQTLEEAVRGHLKGITYDDLFVSDDIVCFDRYNNHDPIQYVISKEWAFSGVAGDLKKTDPREDVTGREGFDGIHLAVHNIAALLSARSTKPSYSDLEQRVEELEEGRQLLIKDCEIWKRKHDELERENASLLDRFGPIDQAEQQAAEVETRFQKLAKKAERIAEICIELNEEIL